MAFQPITVEELLETLTVAEQEEVMRDDFLIPLRLCLKGHNVNALTQHRDEAVNKIRGFARNRNAVRQEIKRNPDVAKTPVDNPLIIIGLPRSGTTLLQRLLASDDQFLSPMNWELMRCTPPGRPENWMECERFKYKLELGCDKFIDGTYDYIQKFRADLSGECLLTFMHYFLDSVEPLPFKSMKEWKEFVYNCPEEHLRNAYDFHKMCLKCVFYGNIKDGKSLLLKSNLHLLYLQKLRETYPNAKLIFPFRDLKETVASYCSLKCLYLDMVGAKDDRQAAALSGLEYIKECTSRAVKVFKCLPEESFIAIAYSDLVREPLDTVKKIYSHFNLQLTPGAEKAMQCYLQENPQNKYGKHEHSLEKFKIAEDDLKRDMAEYLEYISQKIQ